MRRLIPLALGLGIAVLCAIPLDRFFNYFHIYAEQPYEPVLITRISLGLLLFYVLEGEITFTVAERVVVGGPGTFVQIPRGTPHAFKNQSAVSARMLIQCVPAGFDRFMAEFATELPSPAAPPLPAAPGEIAKLLSIAPRYGIVMLPPAH